MAKEEQKMTDYSFEKDFLANQSINAEPKKKLNKKKLLVIAAVSAVVVAILTLMVVFVVSSNPKQPEEYDPTAYEEEDESTGGEDYEFAENETLDFLSDYDISDEDIAFVQEKIEDVLDEYYGDFGYDEVFYSSDAVFVSEDGNTIEFTCETDWRDIEIHVTLHLVGNEIDKVEIF